MTDGGIILVKDICVGRCITLGGRELRADLLVMPLPSFDVVLGMDWLSKNHASIDCRRGCVVFSPPGESVFEFAREEVERQSGAIYEAMIEERKILHPIIAEFLDVFPEELPGMPSDRDIEFAIDLVPGAEPTSQQVYRINNKEAGEFEEAT